MSAPFPEHFAGMARIFCSTNIKKNVTFLGNWLNMLWEENLEVDKAPRLRYNF